MELRRRLCRLVCNSVGFECNSQPSDTQSTKLKSHQYGETRSERFEMKNTASSSQVWHSDRNANNSTERTCGGRRQKTHWYDTFSPQLLRHPENNVGHLDKVQSNVRQKLSRPQGRRYARDRRQHDDLGNIQVSTFESCSTSWTRLSRESNSCSIFRRS